MQTLQKNLRELSRFMKIIVVDLINYYFFILI